VVFVLLAASPLTGAKRLVPSLVLGLAGAALLLGVRLYSRGGEPERSRPAPIARPSPAVWCVIGLALATFAPTLGWLYHEYTASIWRNPHGIFVPFFAILLARHQLRDDTDGAPAASAWGFAWLLPGCALAVLDAGVRSHFLGLLGLLLALPGLSFLLLGSERTRRIAFPLALCAFMLPLPNGMRDPAYLPTLSADLGAHIAQLLGVSVIRTQTRLELAGGGFIEVSQNCSGLSFFYGGLALAAMCIGVARSWTRRVLLLASPYVLAVVANGVRIGVLLVVSDRIGMEWKFDTPIHGVLGTLAFYAVVVGVYLVSDRQALREALA
jgi:exosortase